MHVCVSPGPLNSPFMRWENGDVKDPVTLLSGGPITRKLNLLLRPFYWRRLSVVTVQNREFFKLLDINTFNVKDNKKPVGVV